MQTIVVSQNNSRRNSRSIFVAAALAIGTLAGCSDNNLPPATVPSSGVTSSNGGGMRATGAIPDVSVSNGTANVGTMQRNPVTPRY